tara:strand:- start:45811 stop:46614 length:804 start_codon:yes stop_codon:yes gene_type:complete
MRILFTLFSLLSLSSLYAEEVLYFGDSHSTGTALGRRVEQFLSSPNSSCSAAQAGSHTVTKLNGVGLDPRHWLSRGNSGRNYLYRQLEQSGSISRASSSQSGLDRLVQDIGSSNPGRKLVLEFGDNSTPTGMWQGFKNNILKMRDQLGVSAQNCLVLAPQPHIRESLREGKRQVLTQLRELHQSGECHVVFFDESSTGPLPLTDGIHLTNTGYNHWADQAIAGICRSRLFSSDQSASRDSVQGCTSCLPGMPFENAFPFEQMLQNLR